MRQRNIQPEKMDDPSLNSQEHIRALEGLRRLNRTTGIASRMFRTLAKYAAEHPDRPLRVLDLATGGGDLPIRWCQLAKKQKMALHVVGIDRSATAISYARNRAEKANVCVQFQCGDVLSSSLPTGFDIVTNSLFMHHLTDSQISSLLRSMTSVAKRAVVICDLERSRLNLASIWLASRISSRSSVVHGDATASVHAALTTQEFKELAVTSLQRPIHVQTIFPCRFLAVIDDAAETVGAPAFA